MRQNPTDEVEISLNPKIAWKKSNKDIKWNLLRTFSEYLNILYKHLLLQRMHQK